MKKIIRYIRLKNEKGVSLVMVALLLIPLLGIGALVIDLGFLYAAKNELQNAADAGALAGARVLYSIDGLDRTSAISEATNAAIANFSQGSAIEVNTDDVKIGHWSFGLGNLARGFHESGSTTTPILWDRSTVKLDEDDNFINAVQVTARRQNTLVTAIFSRIFNHTGFEVDATAVGYIGFAGSIQPYGVDQPIGICLQSIIDEDGNYTCGAGRTINSSGGSTTNTGAWTNFTQPCKKTAGPKSVEDRVCRGNDKEVFFGQKMETSPGAGPTAFRDMIDCWKKSFPSNEKDWRGYPTKAWEQTYPVIDCPDKNPGAGGCETLLGAVTLKVIWIKDGPDADDDWIDIPFQMENWECSYWVAEGKPKEDDPLDIDNRQKCWDEFASEFGLQTYDGKSVGQFTPAQIKMSILFLPSCKYHEPTGVTGGLNTGILAKVPLLVN